MSAKRKKKKSKHPDRTHAAKHRGGDTIIIDEAATFKHCDDYIDDETQPQVLRTWLDWARSPAHGAFKPGPHPVLFADYYGKRVRVTVASRFGDVGINYNLSADHGYDLRVAVQSLENFGDTP